MAAITQAKAGAALPVGFYRAPKSYSTAMTYLLQFDAAPSPQPFDLFFEVAETYIDLIQTVFIDNSANAGTFLLQSAGFGTGLKVPGNSQAYLPLFCTQYPSFTGVHTTANAQVPLLFFNTIIPPAVWKSQ